MRTTSRLAGVLAVASLILAVSVVPVHPTGTRGAPALASTSPGTWEKLSSASFDLVYGASVSDPVRLAAEIESAGRTAAALLGCPWPLPAIAGHPVSAPSRPPVFFAALRADPPTSVEGRYVARLDPASATSIERAAAGLVLAYTASSREVSPALTAGLAFLVGEDRPATDAWGVVLSERGRLASIPQLLRWWPSLPLGEAQLGSLTGFILERWGGEALALLAASSPENFSRMSWLNSRVTAALGTSLPQVDALWMDHLEAAATRLDPHELSLARAAAAAEIGRARLAATLLAALAAALLAWGAVRLSTGRRETAWALFAFGAAAAVELALFTGDLHVAAKSLIAVSEVVVFIVILAVFRRREAGSGAPGTGRPAASPAAGAAASPAATTATSDVSAGGGVFPSGAWAALLLAVLLSFAVMAPRFGLYYYGREIWAKAPMIVAVLALVYLAERRTVASVGLGRMPLARLLTVTLAGVFAFRLTTGLTDVLFAGMFSQITGPAFAWYAYEPWWRAVGFAHLPFAPWPSWFPAVDVADFMFGNFAEEIFFRGYLLTRLERSMGWWKALFSQAFLFGLFHINYDLFPFYPLPMVMYVLMATVFGVLMGLLLKYSGTLLVPALLHPMHNLGVLWVGVTSSGAGITWLTLPVYHILLLVLGLLTIPLILRTVSGWFGTPPGPAPRFRDPRIISRAWIETR